VEYYHGQELETKFLDDLWLSILNKVPIGDWVAITKNHDHVVAGIKHFIDCACFGEKMTLVFNNEFTKFRKDEYKSKRNGIKITGGEGCEVQGSCHIPKTLGT